MPKEGYYSLTIRQESADKLIQMAKDEGVSIVKFFENLTRDPEKVKLIVKKYRRYYRIIPLKDKEMCFNLFYQQDKSEKIAGFYVVEEKPYLVVEGECKEVVI